MHIAFLGLGGMGQPMALNLLKAGYALTVWNRSPEPAQALAEQGATVAATPADIAQASVLITILADDIATEQVVVGQGALAALSGSTWRPFR